MGKKGAKMQYLEFTKAKKLLNIDKNAKREVADTKGIRNAHRATVNYGILNVVRFLVYPVFGDIRVNFKRKCSTDEMRFLWKISQLEISQHENTTIYGGTVRISKGVRILDGGINFQGMKNGGIKF